MDSGLVPEKPSLTRPSQNGSALGLLGLALFTSLLLIPAVAAPVLAHVPLAGSFSALALSIVLWVFWLALWPKPRQACLAATPLLIVTPVTMYLLLAYHCLLNPAMLGVILETNIEESKQYLRALWLPIILSYGSLIAIAYLAFHLMAQYEVQWQRRYRLLSLFATPVIFAALHLAYAPLAAAAAKLAASDNNPYSTTLYPFELESARFSSPFGVILQVADTVESERTITAAAAAREAFRFGAHQTFDTADRQVYVLVIGESARKDRWSIYGYTRPTSPRLQREANLVSFGDVVTVAPETRISVPVILTRKTSAQATHWEFAERSLVGAFREAGFTTYWLSTQAPLGTWDASFSIYAKEAEHIAYYNITGGMKDTPPDGVMLEPLKRILAKTAEGRQLIVIHTVGSHLEYWHRYPDEFDVFKPSLEKDYPQLLRDQAYKDKLNNAYDNSILYTDYFLSEVIAAIKASGRPLAAVVYVADHGEDLYDGGCNNWGHGKSTTAALRIPLFFWSSEVYQQRFAAKMEQLSQHRNEPLTTESIFPLLMDTAEIHFPSESLTKSVMSASFVRPSSRIVHPVNFGDMDFDHAHLTSTCELRN